MLKWIAAVILASGLSPTAAWGQATRPMRTRYLTQLTNPEVEEYLKRNDVIFIPVGTVESMGAFPTDLEYTMAEAYALKMAEEADGLVLPHVMYFYPGVTITGRGSVIRFAGSGPGLSEGNRAVLAAPGIPKSDLHFCARPIESIRWGVGPGILRGDEGPHSLRRNRSALAKCSGRGGGAESQ